MPVPDQLGQRPPVTELRAYNQQCVTSDPIHTISNRSVDLP
jgi:hypothetical protein